MRVLVMTVVHHPLDARIRQRQIRSMIDAGWQVTYAAPWTARGIEPPSGLRPVDLPRSTGRDRLGALRAARSVVRGVRESTDLILMHDPELLLSIAGLARLPAVVWDVHEDTTAALSDKGWLPAAARPAVRFAVRTAERWAEHHVHLVLAEDAYRHRFQEEHPVIPNYPPAPQDIVTNVEDRVVYVGRLSWGRGAEELITVGRALAPDIVLELDGWVHDSALEAKISAAQRADVLTWSGGFVPNETALQRIGGALAGLSLLHDEPNYRRSLPTKILEYLSRNVPVVTTPLPAAVEIVERHECGIVVPFEDPGAVVEAIQLLRNDRERRDAMAERGRRAVIDHYSWESVESRFLKQLVTWARSS